MIGIGMYPKKSGDSPIPLYSIYIRNGTPFKGFALTIICIKTGCKGINSVGISYIHRPFTKGLMKYCLFCNTRTEILICSIGYRQN